MSESRHAVNDIICIHSTHCRLNMYCVVNEGATCCVNTLCCAIISMQLELRNKCQISSGLPQSWAECIWCKNIIIDLFEYLQQKKKNTRARGFSADVIENFISQNRNNFNQITYAQLSISWNGFIFVICALMKLLNINLFKID